MKFEILQTKRMLLRKMTVETYRYVFDHYTTKQLLPFLGLNTEKDLSNELAKFEKGITTFNRSFLVFYLLDPSTERVIGWCGYHTWYLEHDRAEIGYVITNEKYKRKGLMKEALEAIIPYGFNTMHLNRIEAFVGPENVPSLKLVEEFGFTREGLLRQHYKKNNVIEDSLVFSLLKSDVKSSG